MFANAARVGKEKIDEVTFNVDRELKYREPESPIDVEAIPRSIRKQYAAKDTIRAQVDNFRNNRLVRKTDNPSSGEYFIGSDPCNQSVTIEYNSFLDDGLTLALLSENACMSALNNYWGTTTETAIVRNIKDKNSDIALKDEILFYKEMQ